MKAPGWMDGKRNILEPEKSKFKFKFGHSLVESPRQVTRPFSVSFFHCKMGNNIYHIGFGGELSKIASINVYHSVWHIIIRSILVSWLW